MGEVIVDLLESVITSPWFYLGLFVVAALDGFFPAVPSESLVITAGVFAATGAPHLAAVVAVAAAGAFVGDHVSYLIGRTWGTRLVGRAAAKGRVRAGFEWARGALARRGGLILVVARYVPGGRTAATMSAGALRYPRRSFTFFDAIAVTSWALYSALAGYLGGMAFEHDPFKALLAGFAVAMSITAVVEVARFVHGRWPKQDAQTPSCSSPAS